MNEITLAEFSVTSNINAPIERMDFPAWIFGLADAEYERCSPAHVATLASADSPDGRRTSINVEVLNGGSITVSHYIKRNRGSTLVYVSLQVYDTFTPTELKAALPSHMLTAGMLC